MAIVILFPFILLGSSIFFKKAGWKVTNYLEEEIPYNLGFCIFVAVFSYLLVNNNYLVMLYVSALWITGFVDDRFGTKYPKGLKGHIGLFVKTGRVTTGLFKLLITLMVSSIFIMLIDGSLLERVAVFSLLILPPHVMNLFDTRPLRVWKVITMHPFIYLPVLVGLSFPILVSVSVIVLSVIYFEGTRRGMLGDNGATLLGGIISVIAIDQLSLSLQLLLICLYIFIILLTEKFSISEWIEKRPLLRRIDRWGVS